MARQKTYKLALTASELELVFLEFESCVGVGGEDPGFLTVRNKAIELLRKADKDKAEGAATTQKGQDQNG